VSIKNNNNNNNSHASEEENNDNNKTTTIWSDNDIAKEISKANLLEPGGHHMLVYKNLNLFRQVYLNYAITHLPQNEIVLLASQYEHVESVKSYLAAFGVNVDKHLADGTLFIVDAQQGYFTGGDIEGTLKLAFTLASRAKKENRSGLTWIGDMGAFFGFEDIARMMDYELQSCPQKYEDEMIKTVCCYHSADFDRLTASQKEALFNHHYKSFMMLGYS
jgi:DcmR-like sensory protein